MTAVLPPCLWARTWRRSRLLRLITSRLYVLFARTVHLGRLLEQNNPFRVTYCLDLPPPLFTPLQAQSQVMASNRGWLVLSPILVSTGASFLKYWGRAEHSVTSAAGYLNCNGPICPRPVATDFSANTVSSKSASWSAVNWFPSMLATSLPWRSMTAVCSE